jgi:hypothetical protein
LILPLRGQYLSPSQKFGSLSKAGYDRSRTVSVGLTRSERYMG